MSFKTLAPVIVGFAVICAFSFPASAQAPTAAPPSSTTPIQDTRLVPIHAQICESGIVDKHKLFVQMAENANPPLSVGLLTSVSWRTIVVSKNVCTTTKACGPKDASAVVNLKDEYDEFLGFSSGYYAASNPNLTVEQYFQGADDVNPIKCIANSQPPLPTTAATSPLDAKSQLRIRGVSDDLWIWQSDSTAFAKSSSATVNFTQNDVAPATQTMNITGAVGYNLLPNVSTLESLVPYVSGNETVTDTYLKPRTTPSTNFVAGGVLYSTSLYDPTSQVENQITFKGQQVDGTAMKSELSSLQLIYAPFTNPIGPLPALNSVEGFSTPDGTASSYYGQVVFNVRNDLGYYENRGLPQYLSQNTNYERFGSHFGYAFIANPTDFPPYSFSVTETALYGATGGPRNLSYFDALLQVYFDQKKLFSATAEYINGRDENTYVLTHEYKLGLSAHY